ncbi:MAG TPA: sodium:calcium antiporter [Acidimicrobiales bacterium]|nr:sodium:calcium antiporter [Acidimicrobiales bacterium]
MLTHVVVLAAGVAAAAVGGDLFVRGAVGLAAWARVPAGLVGATVAAFATSTPELSVGLQASATGRPELALGDALGSNVVNIALVLGVLLLMGPLSASRRELRRDLTLAATAPLLTLLALADGRLVRSEAVVLLVIFGGWLVAVGRQAMRERSAVEEVLGDSAGWRVIVVALAGLAALILAGRLIVIAAKGIGADLGLDPFAVGATLVAVGTSTPELATVVISRRRGHSEIGVGTVLGSNVFNNLWIVGIVALISPVQAAASEVVLAVGACLVALILVVPTPAGVVPRWRGACLVSVAATHALLTVLLGV